MTYFIGKVVLAGNRLDDGQSRTATAHTTLVHTQAHSRSLAVHSDMTRLTNGFILVPQAAHALPCSSFWTCI